MLSEAHAAMLRASAISDEVIEARGYRSIEANEAKSYGFAKWQSMSGLLIPLCGVDCTVKGHQLRPDEPRLSKKGNPVKYETPLGQPNTLDINPLVQSEVAKARKAIFITEGAKKADALASFGIPAISLTGVWNWRGKNPDGG